MPRDPAGNRHELGPSDPPGIVTLESSVGVDELLRRVVAHVQSLGLEVFAVIDHSGAADEVGLTMPDTKLVLFGNPRGGTPLMLAHPLIALDLPPKLLIGSTTDDHVFLSYNAPTYLASRFELSKRETETVGIVDAIARAVVTG
jgi:uncharacterized protein (DUF302 family)